LVIYLIFCFKIFRIGKRSVELKLTEQRKKQIQWTKRELNLFGIICMMIIIIVVLKMSDFNDLAISIIIFLTFMIVISLMVIIMLKLLSYPNHHRTIKNIDVEKLKRIQSLIKEKELYKKESLKIMDVAGDLNISIAELSELINKSHGATFNHFINEIRINEAQVKLASSDDQIKFIMYDVGFSSRSVFNETFKRFTGMTPLKYRKSCKDS